MPDISITIDDRQVRALLSRAPSAIGRAMRSGMTDANTYVLAKAKRYPAQRAGSSYTRTHTLERSWSSRITGSGLSIRGEIGSSGNIAPYNRVVMDRTQQARVHRGRWQTIQSIAESSESTVVRMFADRIAAAGLDR